ITSSDAFARLNVAAGTLPFDTTAGTTMTSDAAAKVTRASRVRAVVQAAGERQMGVRSSTGSSSFACWLRGSVLQFAPLSGRHHVFILQIFCHLLPSLRERYCPKTLIVTRTRRCQFSTFTVSPRGTPYGSTQWSRICDVSLLP